MTRSRLMRWIIGVAVVAVIVLVAIPLLVFGAGGSSAGERPEIITVQRTP